jgi:anti-sigma regulatory factor (Ser/Thr protein kinase)
VKAQLTRRLGASSLMREANRACCCPAGGSSLAVTTVGSPVLELAPDPESVRAARRYVTDRLTCWGLEPLVDTAALLVSEVVTNAVLHARSAVRLAVTRSRDDAVTIAVSDLSRRLPRQRRYAEDASTGRGMRLLNQLAEDWQVTVTSTGKTVSFTVMAAAAAG